MKQLVLRRPFESALATVIPEMEALIGNTIERALLDKGYCDHSAPPDYKFRVFISGQKRRVTRQTKRDLRRRSAIEPVISHRKSEHSIGHNCLWHRQGDTINAVLAAVGDNSRRLICWLRLLLWQIIGTLAKSTVNQPANQDSSRPTNYTAALTTGRYFRQMRIPSHGVVIAPDVIRAVGTS
ncbi:hypothetical protein ABIB94_007933 [Bradyrhizobium sp. JR7.2]